MNKALKSKQTIRLQEKLKVQTFLKNKYKDELDELEAKEALYNYAKSKGKMSFPFSYEDR